MLIKSDVRFFDNGTKLEIKYEVKSIEESIFKAIFGDNPEISRFDFKFDSEDLHLEHENNEHGTVLLYKVNCIDVRAGELLREMCMTSEKLGFIISPITDWYKNKVISLYYAVKRDKYKAHFDLSEQNKGFIYLYIEYYNWCNQ